MPKADEHWMYITIIICSIVIINDFCTRNCYKVCDTPFPHKASSNQERYLHPLLPSLEINLSLNAIEKCRHMYMNILTEVNTKIWWIHMMENFIYNQIWFTFFQKISLFASTYLICTYWIYSNAIYLLIYLFIYLLYVCVIHSRILACVATVICRLNPTLNKSYLIISNIFFFIFLHFIFCIIKDICTLYFSATC